MQASKPDRFHRKTGITEADYEILEAMELFRGLDRNAIRDLLEGSWVQSFAKNTILFLQGEAASRFFIVLDGWVKTFTESRSGEECVVAAFTGGEPVAKYLGAFDVDLFLSATEEDVQAAVESNVAAGLIYAGPGRDRADPVLN